MSTMASADSFSAVTLILPDPVPNSQNSHQFVQLNASLSFEFSLPDSIQTLSSTNSVAGNDISGLLYLPEIDPPSPCRELIYDYVPRNTTTQANLPQSDDFWTWIGVAPWISRNCTLAFLNSARDDSIRAFLFYLPDNGTWAPSADDPTWDLGDGGKWKSWARFPVYAISGQSGTAIIKAMSEYSGNLTSVPYGHTLADVFPPTAYVRLAGLITINGHSTLPSLWVFLLIVLGILMFIIASTSCSMHWLQRRRRERLRRRVANGEVDLEQLGIKKLTVPPEHLEQMPLYHFPEPVEKAESIEKVPNSSEEPTTEKPSSPTQTRPPPPSKTAYSQPTCAICLEDFIPKESLVRELPCRHIFHSECVDTFLRENSSLCPLCKKTSLPRGYCPPVITNAMVRRERMMRRMRDRVPDPESLYHRAWNPAMWRRTAHSVLSLPSRMRRSPAPETVLSTTTPPPHQRAESTDHTSQHEQRASADAAPSPLQATATNTPPSPATSQPPQSSGSEWARQRAVEMAGVQAADDDQAEQQLPRWKKITGKIWPGFG